jgi:hypothetical protein
MTYKRLGFRYLCDIFAVGNVRLIGMSVSDNLSFVLEFTNLKLRILDSDGNLVKDASGNIIVQHQL